jgi:NitT/TauT family transport system substrate-binding protein
LISRRDELAAMVRAMYRTLRWLAATPGTEVARALATFFPDVPAPIYAAAIDRYRALSLYGPDPITRREGVERLQAAMRSGGALDRDIPFEDVVDNTLAEEAIASGPAMS